MLCYILFGLIALLVPKQLCDFGSSVSNWANWKLGDENCTITLLRGPKAQLSHFVFILPPSPILKGKMIQSGSTSVGHSQQIVAKTLGIVIRSDRHMSTELNLPWGKEASDFPQAPLSKSASSANATYPSAVIPQ